MKSDRDDDSREVDFGEGVFRAWCVHQFDSSAPHVMLGRFEGIMEIGRGSFGIVFKVRDPELDREVALKLCKATSEEDRARMLREARLLARLSHPNVVAVHEVGVYDGQDEFHGAAFMVMELVQGLTGRELIRQRPGWQEAVDFYRGAARGLAAAHASGIVHGDFKPSNVIRGDGRTRVVDFGLGHTADPELEAREGGRGTVPYMAPEILEGGGGSPLTDQWAFCVAVWETIEGRRPFDGRSPLSLLESIEAGPGASSASSMPPRLRLALLRGLALEPGERWPDMGALITELDALRLPSAKVSRPRLPGGFLVFAVLGGIVGALAVSTFVDEPSDELQESPASRDATLVGPAAPSETACELDAHPFLTPSPELEAVCQLIRDGRISEARSTWREVREQRAPPRGDVNFEARIMHIATETQVVVDTCDDYAAGAVTEQNASDARTFSKAMAMLYELDKLEIGSSP